MAVDADPGHSREEPHDHHLIDAAIAAELSTGRREETVEEAKRHILIRLGRMTFGFVLLVLGAVMLVVPGPGLVVIFIGLGILSLDFEWARRMRLSVQNRLPTDEQGKIPVWSIAIGVVFLLGGVAASMWWQFLR